MINYREQHIHLGQFECKNCGAHNGYYDVDELRDVCPHCGNPDFKRNDGENVDGSAIRVFNFCASDDLENALSELNKCKTQNPASIATVLADLAYAFSEYNRYGNRDINSIYGQKVNMLIDKFLNTNGLVDRHEVRLFETMYRSAQNDALAVLTSIYDIAAQREAEMHSQKTEYVATNEKSASSENIGSAPPQNDSLSPIKKRAHACYKLVNSEYLTTPLARQVILTAALERHDWKRARIIATNKTPCFYGRLRKGFALIPILNKYPESEEKELLVSQIADKTALESLSDSDVHFLESYLETTKDSFLIKLAAIRNSPKTNAFLGGGKLLDLLVYDAKALGLEQNLFAVICSASTSAKIEALQYLLSKNLFNDFDKLISAFGESQKTFLYDMHAEAFRPFLIRQDVSSDYKIAVLNSIEKYRITSRFGRHIRAIYLCDATDTAAERMKVLSTMITREKPLDPETFKEYVLHCKQDGLMKPDIVEAIIAAGSRIPSDLCEQYLSESMDDVDVQKRIIAALKGSTRPQRRRISAWSLW